MIERRTILLALLVLAVGINYVDRGSLSIVKTDVSSEFSLDAAQMGLLFSAFFWSYAIFQLGAGWLVDRYDVKWVYAAGFLIWSLATVAMGVSGSFAAFFILRLILGFGESVAYPATSRVLVEKFPEDRRGFANALVDAASKVGPALSLLLGGLLVAHWGWRALFLTVGLASLLWLPAWLWLMPRQNIASPANVETLNPSEQDIGFSDLLRRREVWGTSLGFFCLGYTWAFLLSWLPAYLEESRGFSKESMAVFGSLPFWAMAATSIFGGWLADRWIRSGSTPTLVRKTFLIGGLLLCAGFLLLAMQTANPRHCIAWLILASGALGLYTSNAWAMTQTLAGPATAGKWTGLQNAIGNLGGALSPALTGWLVKETGSFSSAFIASSLILVSGVLAYVLLIPQVSPLTWDRTASFTAETSH